MRRAGLISTRAHCQRGLAHSFAFINEFAIVIQPAWNEGDRGVKSLQCDWKDLAVRLVLSPAKWNGGVL
jgi:hypothetical protein